MTPDSNKHTSKSLDVIIETPKGSRHKYAFDPETGLFRLSKMLAQGMVFPYDFGFVPSTKAEDGDPIDLLVLVEEATFPGCLVEVALIGVIEAEQQDPGKNIEQNDRLIGAARQSLLYSHLTNISELDPQILRNMEAFFVNYQTLRNVKLRIKGRRGPERAWELLREGGFRKQEPKQIRKTVRM